MRIKIVKSIFDQNIIYENVSQTRGSHDFDL